MLQTGMMELNKIYCENCLDTMSRMPDEFIDLTVTSPPYDNLRNYNGYVFDFESIAKELFRVTKKGGVVVWVVGDATINGSETGTSFRQALYFMECGFKLHDTMLYAKVNYIPLIHNRYEQSFEYMFVFSKDVPITVNLIKIDAILGGEINNLNKEKKVEEASMRQRLGKSLIGKKKIRANIWYYSVGYSEDYYTHPAAFPEQLTADHIFSWSNEGDLIYDCFSGSGTTAKMAHIQKRKWIASEISSDYASESEKRILPYLMQQKLF